MENVKFIEVEYHGEISEHVIIDRGNGEYTSMPKSVYDEQLAQSKEITPIADEA